MERPVAAPEYPDRAAFPGQVWPFAEHSPAILAMVTRVPAGHGARAAYLPAQQLTSWGHGIALLAKDLLG
jgi:hypothetical protein